MTLPPIQCFTCGKELAHLYLKYHEQVKKGEESGKIMDEMGLKRICCRRMVLTSVIN